MVKKYVEDYFCDSRGDKLAYLDMLNSKHPGYIYELYQYTTDDISSKASFYAISLFINQRSRILSEIRDHVNMSWRQLTN